MKENRFKMFELNWTKFVLPIGMARVLEYFYCSEEQPTYEEAEKELWIVKSCIYHHIKNLEKLWFLKKDKRWTITYMF